LEELKESNALMANVLYFGVKAMVPGGDSAPKDVILSLQNLNER